MKIRHGYVSNSSSSSFLILYNNENEFDKFKSFEGYYTFIKDLKKEQKKDECIYFINNLIKKYVYDTGHCFDNGFSTYDQWEKIDIITDECNIPLDKVIGDFNFRINKMKTEMWKNIHKEDESVSRLLEILRSSNDGVDNLVYRLDHNVCLFWNKHHQKYIQKFYKMYHSVTFKNKLMRIVRKIYNVLNKKYYVKVLSYSDDTKYGDYLEHYFMPFITQNPERKYLILTEGNH